MFIILDPRNPSCSVLFVYVTCGIVVNFCISMDALSLCRCGGGRYGRFFLFPIPLSSYRLELYCYTQFVEKVVQLTVVEPTQVMCYS